MSIVKSEETKVRQEDLSKLLYEVQLLRTQQDNMECQMQDMKQWVRGSVLCVPRPHTSKAPWKRQAYLLLWLCDWRQKLNGLIFSCSILILFFIIVLCFVIEITFKVWIVCLTGKKGDHEI